MTEEHKASRTIVKSPPELWAECSVAQSLARHLGEFGEIRITRLEPETTVAWEGEHASGTVRLEPSGWGTQVTLTATPIVAAVPEPAVEPEVEPEPEPVALEEPEAVGEADVVEQVEEPHDAGESGDDYNEDASEHLPRWPVFARLWGRLGRKSHDADDEPHEDEAETPDAVEETPEPVDEVAEPEFVDKTEEPEAVNDSPLSVPGLDHQALLVGALDSLGQAHHRPFSRA
ncbi:MAG: hypothetical protein ACXVVQ_12620 [Solirubrobacteraceae bacterium]